MRFSVVLLAAFAAVNPFGWDQHGPLRFALISSFGFLAIAVSFGAGDVRSQPLPRWSVIGWVMLIASMLISTVLSNDVWHALIGTPSRHFGLVTWVLLAGLFAASSLYPGTLTKQIQATTLIATATVGGWAILEALDIGWFSSTLVDDRAGATFGQPAFLGAAMVLAIPICLSRVLDRRPKLAVRIAAGAASALGVVALGLSQSRAALVAAAIVAMLSAVRRRNVVAGVAVIAIVVGVLVLTPLGDRAATLTELDEGVVAGRLDDLQVGVRAVSDTPTFGLTGHGPEGYRIAIGTNIDDDYIVQHGRDLRADRAHNGLVDIALAGGVFAGLAALLLHAGLAITALQRLRADDPFEVALAAAVLGYVIQQLFFFPTTELDPVLWIFAGVLVSRLPRRVSYPPPLFREVSGSKRAVMFGAGFLAALASIGGLSDVAADHAVASAFDGDDVTQALQHADTARQRRPDSIRYHLIAARLAAEPGTLDAYRNSLDRLDDGLRISPNDPELIAERADLLLEIAFATNEETNLSLALDELSHATSSDPRNPSLLTAIGIAHGLNEDPESALQSLSRAVELDPTGIEALLSLAQVQLETGDLESGGETLERVDALAPANAQAQSLRRRFLLE